MLLCLTSISRGVMNFFEMGVPIPPYPDTISGPSSIGTIATIDATDEKVAMIVQIPKTGAIRRVAARVGTVTTGSSPGVRIETVATTGFPTGTLYCANATSTFTYANADDNTWQTSGDLAADCSATRGDIVALVIVGAATPGSAVWSVFSDARQTFPYLVSSTTTAGYSKSAGDQGPTMAFEYADGTYTSIFGVYPIETITTISVSTNSTPNAVGNKFTFPIDVSATGAWVWMDQDGDGDVVIFDNNDVVIATATFTADVDATNAAGIRYFVFNTSVTLTANTVYRLILRDNVATVSQFHRFDADSNAVFEAFPFGSDIVYTSAKDPHLGGAWTDATSQRGSIGLIVNGFGSTAAGGGTSAFPFVQ